MRDKGPCYECSERHLHCHKSCEAYISYASALRARNEHIRDIKDKEDIYKGYIHGCYKRHRIDATIARKKKQSHK